MSNRKKKNSAGRAAEGSRREKAKQATTGKSGCGDKNGGKTCATGNCPLRRHSLLITGGIYGAWIIFLLVLALRQLAM